ncbi:hypothetical protein F443_20802, partial [Phytophthora nicotianae P1569]
MSFANIQDILIFEALDFFRLKSVHPSVRIPK